MCLLPVPVPELPVGAEFTTVQALSKELLPAQSSDALVRRVLVWVYHQSSDESHRY